MQTFEFNGRTARLAKRRALHYWYTHRGRLNMSMTEFFQCCRLREDGSHAQIIFTPRQAA